MRKIIDGRFVDTNKTTIADLTYIKEELKKQERELFLKINHFLKETKD